jgi:hypothetical protein
MASSPWRELSRIAKPRMKFHPISPMYGDLVTMYTIHPDMMTVINQSAILLYDEDLIMIA